MSKTTKPDRIEHAAAPYGRGYAASSDEVEGVPRAAGDVRPALDGRMASDPVREGRKAAPLAAPPIAARSRQATRRLRYCVGFLRREEAGLTDRSAASMEAAIRDIHCEDRPRSDPSPATDRPPRARTLREWLRRHEGDDGRPDAVATRPRGPGRHRSMTRRTMAAFVTRYASAERPTVLDCYGAFLEHARTLNETRAASGRAPLHVPSPSTFARAVGALDRFDVIARRHGPAAARRAMGLAP